MHTVSANLRLSLLASLLQHLETNHFQALNSKVYRFLPNINYGQL